MRKREKEKEKEKERKKHFCKRNIFLRYSETLWVDPLNKNSNEVTKRVHSRTQAFLKHAVEVMEPFQVIFFSFSFSFSFFLILFFFLSYFSFLFSPFFLMTFKTHFFLPSLFIT